MDLVWSKAIIPAQSHVNVIPMVCQRHQVEMTFLICMKLPYS